MLNAILNIAFEYVVRLVVCMFANEEVLYLKTDFDINFYDEIGGYNK